MTCEYYDEENEENQCQIGGDVKSYKCKMYIPIQDDEYWIEYEDSIQYSSQRQEDSEYQYSLSHPNY